MARVIVLLLLLVFSPSFIQQAKNLAVADNQLIQTLCHNSETPETCMRCVYSSKNSEKADSVGIATIIVNCLSDLAKTLVGNLTQVASSTTDKKLKTFCQNCAKDYDYQIGKKDLISAKQDLENHKYDNAESSVVEALILHHTCRKNLEPYIRSSLFSTEVAYYIRVYDELSEAACRVIEKIYV
ncbi:Pectinesterase inhibitor domain [Sesbania bispinosa]|nr:Pectinesterase inhibitor domain [Sesbania bispinosa]